MTDVPTGAPADAGSEQIVSPPNPISTDNVDHAAEQRSQEKAQQEQPKDESAKKPSIRDSIKSATQKVEADEKANTGDKKGVETAKPDVAKDQKGEAKAEPAKAEAETTNGKDAATPAADAEAKATPDVAKPGTRQPHDDAPTRFSNEAKASWGETSEHVRAETHRAIRELETGIQEHQKRWEPIRPFDDLAKQHGTTVHEALDRYVHFDRALNENLAQGLEFVIRDKTGGKHGLQDFIAEFTGKPVDHRQQASDQTSHALRQEIAELKRQIGGVTSTMRSQVGNQINQQVEAFAAEHPNIEALAPQIVEHIQSGMSLEQAYQKAEEDARVVAEKLGFIPKPADTPAPTPSAQTDRGTRSIAGAPGTGSSPAAPRKPGKTSIRDSVRRAIETVR